MGRSGRNRQLFGENPLPGFGNDQMDFGDARIGFEQSEHFLCEDGPARAGDTYGNGLGIGFGHVASRIIQSRSGSGASQGAAREPAMIEFSNGGSDELTGNFE